MADDVQIFTLNGISKTYALPGLKLGWIVTTGPDTAENVEHLELSVDTFLACNSIGQSMLPLIIREGEPFIKSFRNRVEESRNAALKVLSQKKSVSCIKPQGGFYLFAEIHGYPGTDEDLAADILEKTGILVHPGYFYDYEKSLHILISCLMEAPKLEEQINTLVKLLP
jgi:aspartate/methionine/tyrosine aminotransferase